jgi:hypothetical protein
VIQRERETCGGNDGSGGGFSCEWRAWGSAVVKVEQGASHSTHRGQPKKIYANKTPQHFLEYYCSAL